MAGESSIHRISACAAAPCAMRLISKLLGVVRRQFTLEGHNAELWDETARRFEHVSPLELELLPEDSMLREFYGGAADRMAQDANV